MRSLRRAAAYIDDARVALDRGSRRLVRVSTDGVGAPRLAEAVDEFVARWEYAVDRIGSVAAATAERLRAAANAYDKTEEAVAQAAGEDAR